MKFMLLLWLAFEYTALILEAHGMYLTNMNTLYIITPVILEASGIYATMINALYTFLKNAQVYEMHNVLLMFAIIIAPVILEWYGTYVCYYA